MNKKLLLTFLATAGLLNAATNESDFIKGVDLTSTNYITPSLLNQLIDEATPATNRGMIVRQSSTPDIANNPQQTNYIWLDTSTDPATLKRYNVTSNTWDAFTLTLGTDDVNSSNIANGAVTTVKIQDLAVTEAKISAGSVTSSKLGDSSVTRIKIVDGAIDGDKITNAVLTSAHILDGTIATADLGDASVTTAKLVDTNVTTAKIVDLAVTTAKLGESSVTSNKLAASSVLSSNIVDATITGTDIAASTITTNNIGTNLNKMLPQGIFHVSGSQTNFAGNIASITRPDNSLFLITFNTAQPSTNYLVIATGMDISSTHETTVFAVVTNTTSLFWLKGHMGGGALQADNGVYGVIYAPLQ